MMRQSSSRNHRSRGWKVKHALQICLLVAVCVWLLYQVKHSHDKKKALEEGALKVSDRVEESRPDFLKLGRKDPQGSAVVQAMVNTADNEEEENEEAEEAAEQENKQGENEEEERRGAGDDELDESDQERGDDEAEGGEEFGDEEEKERQSEDVTLLENGDHDDDEVKSQGAREEHYKADDASSAVVRDTQEIGQENENLEAGNLDVVLENTEKGELENDAKTNTEKGELENDAKANGTEVTSTNDEMHNVPTNSENQLENNISLNDTTVRERELEVESPQNQTMVLESPAHVEEHSIFASNSSDHLEQHNNSITAEQQSDSAGTDPGEQMRVQNVSIGNTADGSDSTPENETVNVGSTQDDSRVNGTGTLTQGNSISAMTLVEQIEKSNVTEGAVKSDETLNSSSVTNVDGDPVQGEARNALIDVSTTREEDPEAQTDLSTLPNTQVEMTKEEEIAAE